ncbi:MAG: apolipoprotein N-acyltransferase [Bacteroidales bacterium]
MDYSLAVFSGVLLVLSFPRFGNPGFAWIALTPLLVALWQGRARRPQDSAPFGRPRGPARPFLLGLVTGGVYFAGTLYWVGAVMQTFGGLNVAVSALVALLLVSYLALFPAIFALTCGRLFSTFGAWGFALAPAAWVATEYGRSYLLTGFPWVLLGYSQARVLQVAQLASVFGIFGLSALVAIVNGAIAYLLVAGTQARTRGADRYALRGRIIAAGVAVSCVVATSVWGTLRLGDASLTRQGSALKVGIVQGNVPQDEKWDQARASAIFQRYLDLTRAAAKRGASFIVWPESSTPFLLEEDPFGRAAIAAIARQSGAYILVGSDQVQRGKPAKYYNAAFLVGPDGGTLATYRKMHLVPFGEYVPLKSLLFFANKLVEGVSDFSPGDQAVLLPVGTHPVSTSICYEVVYPDLVRRFVLGGSQILTTITNDAWYGHSSAPYQHFEQAAVRAIEEGRYLVRSANTGISAIVDPYGRVVEQSALFEPAVLVGDVRALTGLTLYARLGDVIAYVSLAITLLALVVATSSRYR